MFICHFYLSPVFPRSHFACFFLAFFPLLFSLAFFPSLLVRFIFFLQLRRKTWTLLNWISKNPLFPQWHLVKVLKYFFFFFFFPLLSLSVSYSKRNNQKLHQYKYIRMTSMASMTTRMTSMVSMTSIKVCYNFEAF